MTGADRIVLAIDALRRNVQSGARFLIRTPSFTIPAVASLSLAIAVNTTLFSVFDAAILEPLGAADAELVRIGRSMDGDGTFRSLNADELRYLRDRSTSLAAITGHDIETLVLPSVEGARRISGEWVVGDYFSVLGVRPQAGRIFSAHEASLESAEPVVIVSDAFARRAFPDSGPVGKPLRIGTTVFTVVGVLPADFAGTFPGVRTDVWIPAGSSRLAKPAANAGTELSLQATARLKDGISLQTARAELRTLAAQLSAENSSRDRRRGFETESARGVMPLIANVLRVFLLALMGVLGIVLLIACANVANLLLARGAGRRTELAVRQACGAGRGRIVGMLLVESLLLAAIAGATGTAIAWAGVRLLRGLSITTGPTGAPVFFDLHLDTTVLAFTAIITTATALLFGLAPAIAASRVDLLSALKDVTSIGGHRSRLRSTLVVVQVTFSFVLLVGAALLMRSLHRAARVDLGFAADSVVTSSFEWTSLAADPVRTAAFYDDVVRRLGRIPGVEGLALASFLPMHGGIPSRAVTVAGETDRGLSVYQASVSGGFFATVRQSLVRGSEFTSTHRAATSPVAVVNETFARRLARDGNALGMRLRLSGDSVLREIIGVVRDARLRPSHLGGATDPVIYLPIAPGGTRPIVYLYTRAPGVVEAEVARAVAAIDPTVAVSSAPLRRAVSLALVPARVGQAIFAVAGAIALLLASAGLYGLVSYTLAQRLREIGIRMALGASSRRVFGFVTGDALRLLAIGVSIGAVLAATAMRLLRSLLHGISPTDPIAFGAIAAVLVVAALAASLAAGRRALQIDPAIVLKQH